MSYYNFKFNFLLIIIGNNYKFPWRRNKSATINGPAIVIKARDPNCTIN